MPCILPLLWALKGWSQIHLHQNVHKQQSYLIHPLSQDQSYQTSLSPCTVQSIISTSAHFTSSLITLSRRNSSFCILLAMNMTQTPLDSSFGPIIQHFQPLCLETPKPDFRLQCAYDHKECGLFFIQTDSQLVDYWKKMVISVVLLAYFLVVSVAIVDFLEGFATHSKDAG